MSTTTSAYPDNSKLAFEISKAAFELFSPRRAVHVRAPPSAPQVLPSYSPRCETHIRYVEVPGDDGGLAVCAHPDDQPQPRLVS